MSQSRVDSTISSFHVLIYNLLVQRTLVDDNIIYLDGDVGFDYDFGEDVNDDENNSNIKISTTKVVILPIIKNVDN